MAWALLVLRHRRPPVYGLEDLGYQTAGVELIELVDGRPVS